MTILPLGHMTAYLSVTLARPDSMHTSLTIPPAAWVGGVILPLGLSGLCLLGVCLVGILMVRD